MALDGAEADVDVGGKMSHLTGAKLAFTDPKVCLSRACYLPVLMFSIDLPASSHVPLHCWCNRLPESVHAGKQMAAHPDSD